jgi:energy-coupling factor transporter ATP-binding protein EcfA2
MLGWDEKGTEKENRNGHLVDLRLVEKTYAGAAGEFPALRGINLQLERGDFAAVIGKSGSGKSTLLNVLTGIDRPTAGLGGWNALAPSERGGACDLARAGGWNRVPVLPASSGAKHRRERDAADGFR